MMRDIELRPFRKLLPPPLAGEGWGGGRRKLKSKPREPPP
jgi:hypothetical protein